MNTFHDNLAFGMITSLDNPTIKYFKNNKKSALCFRCSPTFAKNCDSCMWPAAAYYALRDWQYYYIRLYIRLCEQLISLLSMLI